ncbi:MAG: mycofactocin biosynthesis glycosyltransferase MftF [Mycobacteriales bacterium]
MSAVFLAPAVQRPVPELLVGGVPPRRIRLSPQGVAALDALLAGTTHPGAVAVQRRLLSHAMLLRRPGPGRPTDVTVVIPARCQQPEMERTLASIPAGVPVIVVDDGSTPALSARPGLRIHRSDASAGPAVARNRGATDVTTDLLAFVDTDVVLPVGWLDRLSGYFDAAEVVAVAPRVRSRPARGAVGVLEADLCALDLGAIPADVREGAAVSYLPSTVLLVRRSAFEAVGGFDSGLRVGEDVDLIWRLQAVGIVRYAPEVVARHGPRRTLRSALYRRFEYGTSAAALDRRHPHRLSHLAAAPWSLLPWLTGLCHPVAGLAVGGLLVIVAPATRTGRAVPDARRRVLAAEASAARAAGRYALRPGWPLLLLAAIVTSRFGRRATPTLALSYLAAVRSEVCADPAGRFAARLALRVLDDLVYGAGVWHGCVTARRFGPLLPRLRAAQRR